MKTLHRINTPLRVSLATALLLVAAGCTTTTGSANNAASTLENRYWKLVELDGKPVAPAEHQREAHIILRGGNPPALGGSGGCNRLMGSYTLDGQHITFGNVAMTMMACPQGMDTEHAFTEVLSGKKQWQANADTLLFKDGSGNTVARFVVVYL